MSYSESSPPRGGKGKQKKSLRRKPARSPSASEISKNTHHFEIWCTYQNLERASYKDIPNSQKGDVAKVFDVTKRLPLAWVEKDSEGHKLLSTYAPPEFILFISQAYDEDPSLFSEDLPNEDLPNLYLAVATVWSAWKELKNKMLTSNEKWSESDFADVYAQLRRPAISSSTIRTQCCISLPQPLMASTDFEAARILGAKKSIPDCLTMIPKNRLAHLSDSADSVFTRLKAHKAVKKTGSAVSSSSFAFQATIRHSLSDSPCFEICSSIFEDKKPAHSTPEHAYNQNRMSTASVARQLHSLHIDAPVFGLTWVFGEVRAHIDWCKRPSTEEKPVVYSACYYPPASGTAGNDDKERRGWNLGRASEILQLHFLIENIDSWTTGAFLKRVVQGVTALERSIVKDERAFEPWRRSGDIVPRPRRSLSTLESAELSASILTQPSTPPKPKKKSSRTIR